MVKTYAKYAELFKALGDENRLLILEMLCKGERCDCKILEKFKITQPTLSHHMKILCDCGMVNKRKDGKWMFYSIDAKGCEKIKKLLNNLTTVIDCECSVDYEECSK
jgi:ArsR family transcriptional regulator